MTYVKRIGDDYLKGEYLDGDVVTHSELNELETIVKTGINENYYDIQDITTGDTSVGNSIKINGSTLSKAIDETLANDDNKIPSSKQVKNYVDTQLNSVNVYRGTIVCDGIETEYTITHNLDKATIIESLFYGGDKLIDGTDYDITIVDNNNILITLIMSTSENDEISIIIIG